MDNCNNYWIKYNIFLNFFTFSTMLLMGSPKQPSMQPTINAANHQCSQPSMQHPCLLHNRTPLQIQIDGMDFTSLDESNIANGNHNIHARYGSNTGSLNFYSSEYSYVAYHPPLRAQLHWQCERHGPTRTQFAKRYTGSWCRKQLFFGGFDLASFEMDTGQRNEGLHRENRQPNRRGKIPKLHSHSKKTWCNVNSYGCGFKGMNKFLPVPFHSDEVSPSAISDDNSYYAYTLQTGSKITGFAYTNIPYATI